MGRESRLRVDPWYHGGIGTSTVSNREVLPQNPAGGGSVPGAARPRVVLDTDTFNEIDDQFAVAYLIRANDRVQTEAVYAAPYVRGSAATPGEGMELSYAEIGRLLELLGRTDVPRFRGATRFLTGASSGATGPTGGGARARDTGVRAAGDPDGVDASAAAPAESQAARDLVERALARTDADRLNVVAIGALTNVACAILSEPSITERITVTWLGGHYPTWPHQDEFNLTGDPLAARVVFDSQVPLYIIPCLGVAAALRTTADELRHHMGEDPLSRFLLGRFEAFGAGRDVWSKVIWDIAAVAWLVLPESVASFQVATPRVVSDGSYIHDPRRHPCRVAYELDRDAIYRDLFTLLTRHDTK